MSGKPKPADGEGDAERIEVRDGRESRSSCSPLCGHYRRPRRAEAMNEPTRGADALTAVRARDPRRRARRARQAAQSAAFTTEDPQAELALQALDRHGLIRYVTSPSAKDSSNRRSSSRPLELHDLIGW